MNIFVEKVNIFVRKVNIFVSKNKFVLDILYANNYLLNIILKSEIVIFKIPPNKNIILEKILN